MSKMGEFAIALANERKVLNRTDQAFEKEFLQRYIRGLKPLPKKADTTKKPNNQAT